jgi:hypothetical protein
MSENLLSKKVEANGKTGKIVRVYPPLRIKEFERVNVLWDDGTVTVEVRIKDLKILE